MYEKLQNLNNLRRLNKRGIYKQWIYNSIDDFNLVCDYLQKINYSIQDLNNELKVTMFGMKEIVYIISLIDWIKDSYTKIINKLRSEVANNYQYTKKEYLKLVKEYFIAIRSFIVAHPIGTTKHQKFGFDGNYICIDLRTKDNALIPLIQNDQFFYIDYQGLHFGKNKNHYYYLLSYSNSIDGNKFSKYISFAVEDILNVAKVYIDGLYELDDFLSKQNKRNYRVN